MCVLKHNRLKSIYLIAQTMYELLAASEKMGLCVSQEKNKFMFISLSLYV